MAGSSLAYPLLILSCLLQFCQGKVAQRCDSACGDVIVARPGDHDRYFESPGYPRDYPNNVDCLWDISAPPGTRIHLTSQHFSIEPHRECHWDYLSVKDGRQAESGHTVYCGQHTLNVTSHSSFVSIAFHSDTTTTAAGFRIYYSVVPTDMTLTSDQDVTCNVTLTQPGEITSPNYPQSYPPDTVCFYTIQVPPKHSVRITFTHFHVETRPCLFDKLLAFNDSSRDTPIVELCGGELPPPLTLTADVITLQFVSDMSMEYSGFKASLQFLPSAQETFTTTGVLANYSATTADMTTTTHAPPATTPEVKRRYSDCNVTITDASALITSPGFPTEYPEETVCVTRLRSNDIRSYLIRFQNFTVEESEDCTYDSLTIYPVEAAGPDHVTVERVEPPLRVMCGSLLGTDNVLNWDGRGLDLVFRSDKSVNAAGFLAETFIAPLTEAVQCQDFCDNGGTCLETLLPDSTYDWKCLCPEGYTDFFCQTEIKRTCSDVTCENEGVCRDSEESGPSCACPTGYGGQFCEEFSNPFEGEAMYFTKMSGNKTVSSGSELFLECSVSDVTATVMWLFNDRILTNADGSRGVLVLAGGVVRIPVVKEEHVGRYTCMALTSDDLLERSIWLELIKPCTLDVIVEPENQTVREGHTAMFGCLIQNASLTYWRKDGDLLRLDGGRFKRIQSYLVISSAVESDTGRYTCIGKANNGCFSHVSAYLTVQARGHTSGCGRPVTPPTINHAGRISMGRRAPKGSHPWHAVLREVKRGTIFCGASLISEDTLLTAAHCVSQFFSTFGYPFHRRYIQIYLGTNHCEGKGGIFRKLKSYAMHDDFKVSHYNNDIALFKLDRPVLFSDDIMPICLETPAFLQNLLQPGRAGLISGCGGDKLKSQLPTHLKEVQIPYVDPAVCGSRAASVNTSFTSAMFCAGYKESMRGDACAGDSGGPYVIQYHGRSIQAGIISWGVGCDRQWHYGYYTNVSHFYDWIMERLH